MCSCYREFRQALNDVVAHEFHARQIREQQQRAATAPANIHRQRARLLSRAQLDGLRNSAVPVQFSDSKEKGKSWSLMLRKPVSWMSAKAKKEGKKSDEKREKEGKGKGEEFCECEECSICLGKMHNLLV